MGGYALVWRHSASTCTGWQVGAGKEESFFVKGAPTLGWLPITLNRGGGENEKSKETPVY